MWAIRSIVGGCGAVVARCGPVGDAAFDPPHWMWTGSQHDVDRRSPSEPFCSARRRPISQVLMVQVVMAEGSYGPRQLWPKAVMAQGGYGPRMSWPKAVMTQGSYGPMWICRTSPHRTAPPSLSGQDPPTSGHDRPTSGQDRTAPDDGQATRGRNSRDAGAAEMRRDAPAMESPARLGPAATMQYGHDARSRHRRRPNPFARVGADAPVLE